MKKNGKRKQEYGTQRRLGVNLQLSVVFNYLHEMEHCRTNIVRYFKTKLPLNYYFGLHSVSETEGYRAAAGLQAASKKNQSLESSQIQHHLQLKIGMV